MPCKYSMCVNSLDNSILSVLAVCVCVCGVLAETKLGA